MKKTIFNMLLSLCLLFFCYTATAQDLIIKSDGSIIRALISEIDDFSILYHKWEDPSGPAFRIGLDKVIKVQYQNGTEQSFTKSQSQVLNDNIFSSKLDRSGRLEYIGRGDFRLSGRKILDNSQYVELFAPEGYYDTFKSAQTQRRMGSVFIPLGAGLLGFGSLCAAISIINAVEYNKEAWQTEIWNDSFTKGYMIASIAFYAVGGTLLSIGIPLKIIGTNRLKGIADEYNTRHSTTASLNIGPTPDGFGMMLYF